MCVRFLKPAKLGKYLDLSSIIYSTQAINYSFFNRHDVRSIGFIKQCK